nr:hypothetical protein [Tanacetum cinerariifolium]
MHLVDIGLPATNLNEGTRKSQPLPVGTTTDPQDSEGNTHPADKGLPFMVTNHLGTGSEDQVDTTQSNQLESDPYHNKGKTSSEVDPDTEPPIIQTFCDYQAFLEDSKEELKSSLDFKAFENNIPTTERVLDKTLQGFSSFLYDYLSKDNWVKHEEAATSYVDLRVVMEKYAEENDYNRNQTEIMTQLNAYHTSINSLSSQCTSISESLKEDREFNQRLLRAAKGSSFTTPNHDKGKSIARDTDESSPKLVKSFREVRLDPRAPTLIDYEINGVMYQLTNEEIHAHMENVSEWDELSVIIPKKKNKVVNELMTSLSNKYGRLKEIPGELGSNPSLPLRKQDHSLPSS